MIITKESAIIALRKFPEVAAEMAIKGNSLAIYKFIVEHGSITTKKASIKFCITREAAYKSLLKLEYKRYISSESAGVTGGGYELVYRAMFNGDID